MRRLSVVLLLAVVPIFAQVPKGAEDNAALRYWNAFALMSDQQLTDTQTKQLEAIANGTSPWDEATFGKLLNDNAGAVKALVRGTALPYCTWGVDYALAEEAPIPQVGRGRALARLNLLNAQRLATKGDSHTATDHLIAGLRFGRDLTAGLPLIGAVAGASAITADFNTALALAHSGQLAPEDKVRFLSAVRALPPASFDWAAAVHIEGAGLHATLEHLRSAKDPGSLLKRWGMPEEAQKDPHITEADIQQVDRVMAAAEQLLRKSGPPDPQALAKIQAATDALRPTAAAFVPSMARMAERRAKLEALRQQVLSTM